MVLVDKLFVCVCVFVCVYVCMCVFYMLCDAGQACQCSHEWGVRTEKGWHDTSSIRLWYQQQDTQTNVAFTTKARGEVCMHNDTTTSVQSLCSLSFQFVLWKVPDLQGSFTQSLALKRVKELSLSCSCFASFLLFYGFAESVTVNVLLRTCCSPAWTGGRFVNHTCP